jgi:hypothetical protein
MSFKLFIYYCAVLGAGGAFLGWALGRWFSPTQGIMVEGMMALCLGLGVALALGALDAVWTAAHHGIVFGAVRVLPTLVLGSLGGLLGGLAGQTLFTMTSQWEPSRVVGWALMGLLIGGSLGVFDLLASLRQGEATQGAWRKIRNGLVGGTVGGLLGGVLVIVLRRVWINLFEGKDPTLLWSPGVSGFLALGVFIGLLVALAQVILKEAWLRVEAGFRPGRELILTRPITTIGRGEHCDVGLFGDAAVSGLHARIIREGEDYVLVPLQDAGFAAITSVNGDRVTGRRVLRSGDTISMGRSVLRFGERRKRSASSR